MNLNFGGRNTATLFALRHLHLQYHDCDDDSEHAVAESSKPALVMTDILQEPDGELLFAAV